MPLTLQESLAIETKLKRPKHRGRRFLIAALTLLVLAAGAGIFAFENRSSGITPASINSSMEKWCTTPVFGAVGVAQVKGLFANQHPSNAADGLTCSQNGVRAYVLFFRTAFDENAYLSQVASGFDWTGSAVAKYANPITFSVGHGFVAYFGWPKADTNTTEGQVVAWMESTFGAVPKTSGLASQDWTGILSAINLSSFGKPAPLVFNGSTTATTSPTTTTTTFAPPTTTTAVIVPGGEIFSTANGMILTFAESSSALTDAQSEALKKFTKALNSSASVTIDGYAPSQALATSRANAVATIFYEDAAVSGAFDVNGLSADKNEVVITTSG